MSRVPSILERKKVELETARLAVERERLEIERKKLTYNERFRNITTGLQSIAVVLGGIIGGLFAYFKYSEVESPQALAARRRPALDLAIEVERKTGMTDFAVVAGMLVVNNVGDGHGVVPLRRGQSIVYMSKLDFSDNGPVPNRQVFTSTALSSYFVWTTFNIRPKDTIRFPFAFKVSERGTYVITAALPMSEADRKDISPDGSLGDHFWSASTLVQIE